jgi:hypothetical protein
MCQTSYFRCIYLSRRTTILHGQLRQFEEQYLLNMLNMLNMLLCVFTHTHISYYPSAEPRCSTSSYVLTQVLLTQVLLWKTSSTLIWARQYRTTHFLPSVRNPFILSPSWWLTFHWNDLRGTCLRQPQRAPHVCVFRAEFLSYLPLSKNKIFREEANGGKRPFATMIL